MLCGVETGYYEGSGKIYIWRQVGVQDGRSIDYFTMFINRVNENDHQRLENVLIFDLE